MNIFAQIIPLFRYEKVAYYSVVMENHEDSLFEQFLETHTRENKDKLYHISKWLQIIGEQYGAQNRFFRNEANTADTSALPPTGALKPRYVENGKKKKNNLRLYCLKANENVVFLFSGGLKTAKKAQDCSNVKSHFELANKLTKAIDQAFKDKDIMWIENYSLVEYDEDLKLYF